MINFLLWDGDICASTISLLYTFSILHAKKTDFFFSFPSFGICCLWMDYNGFNSQKWVFII